MEPDKKRPPLPVDASKLTREIVDEWMRWVGPARAFIGHAHQCFNLSPALITRLMKILGLISARPRKPPRFRGATLPLSPGTMLVTDGKWLKVRLLDSQHTVYFNWQGIVDHARPRSRTRQPNPEALALIDHVFQRNQLLSHDPEGKLRRYLATFNPTAIRRAAAILAAKLQQNQIDHRYAHRYLTKQDELALELVDHELLELTQRQNQNWIERE